jgi:hypothetical protein
MPGLSVPNAEDSASTSEDPADSQMDTLTKLSANELLLMFLTMSPEEQSAFSAQIPPAGQPAPVRNVVDGATSRSAADLLGGFHVGQPSAGIVEPVVANEASATAAPVQPSSGGTPSEIFGAKVDALAKRNNFTLSPEGRAGLLFAMLNLNLDATSLIIQVPGAAASPKIWDKLTIADQREYDLWSGSISAEFEQNVITAITNKPGHALIPFEVKSFMDREVGIRSQHRLRVTEQLSHVSIDGFKALTVMGGIEGFLSSPPRASTDGVTLDSTLVPFDHRALSFGHGLVEIDNETWQRFAEVTIPTARVLMNDRSLISYEMYAGLVLFHAAQDFLYRLVMCVLACGSTLNASWAKGVIHDVHSLSDGSGSHYQFSGDFVPTVSMFLLSNFSQGCAHMHGSTAHRKLEFAQATANELGKEYTKYSQWRLFRGDSALDNVKALTRIANQFNRLKASCGSDNSTTHYITEPALCVHFVAQMLDSYLNGPTEASLDSDYVRRNFIGHEFTSLQALTRQLQAADREGKLRGSVTQIASAHAVQAHPSNAASGSSLPSNSPRFGMSSTGFNGNGRGGHGGGGGGSSGNGGGGHGGNHGGGGGNARGGPGSQGGRGGNGRGGNAGNGGNVGNGGKGGKAGKGDSGNGSLSLQSGSGSSQASHSSSGRGQGKGHNANGSFSSLSSGGSSAPGRIDSYSAAEDLIRKVIRSPAGEEYMEEHNIEFHDVFMRVKLRQIDPQIGPGITVNRLVSRKAADWVRKVSDSPQIPMALGYLRKAIDPESDHRLMELINALPTRPNGPAARVHQASSANALAASSMAPGISASAALGHVLDEASVVRLVSTVVRSEIQRLQREQLSKPAVPALTNGAADSQAAAGALVPGGGSWSWDQPPSP